MRFLIGGRRKRWFSLISHQDLVVTNQSRELRNNGTNRGSVLIRTTSRTQVKMDGDRCAACLSSARRCEVRNAPSVIAVLSELVQEWNAHVFSIFA